MLCARFFGGTKTSKWQTSFVSYENIVVLLFCPSYSSNTPMTYCFDFGGIWYPKQSSRTALRHLVRIVNIRKLSGIRHMKA